MGCLYVVGVGTFVCYLLLVVAQKRLQPSEVAAYNYIQPVVAAVAGVCWGVDVLTWEKAAAIVLIAAGVGMVTRAPKPAVR